MIILITGATHTGKTTGNRSIIKEFQSAGEPVILVEDDYEKTIQ